MKSSNILLLLHSSSKWKETKQWNNEREELEWDGLIQGQELESDTTIKHASEQEWQEGNLAKELKEEWKEIEDFTKSLTTSEPDLEVAKLDLTETEGKAIYT